MASIYSKRGILYLTYYIEDEYGRKKQKTFSLNLKDTRENRKLAKKIKTDKEAELNKPNQKVMLYRLTLRDAIKIYTKDKNNVSEKTKEMYKISFGHLTNFIPFNRLVNEIKERDMQNYINYLEKEKGLSKNSISSYVKDVKTLWNWMVKQELVIKNIVPVVKQEAKAIKTISDSDFKLILEELFKKNIVQYRFIKFLRLTGFRISEAIALRWENIIFRSKRIIMKNIKMKRLDEFPLYPELENFLLEFKEKEGKLFPYKSKDSLHFWPRLMAKMDLNYNLHSIRKTFATKLVNNSVTVFDAMKLLRHRKVETTIKYYTSADLHRLGQEAEKVFCNSDFENSQKNDASNQKNLKIVKMNI